MLMPDIEPRTFRSTAVAVALALAIAACGKAAPQSRQPSAQDAASINLQPTDVPDYRAEQRDQISMFVVEDNAAACAGASASTAHTTSSPEFVGTGKDANGLLASRVSVFTS